MRQKKGLENQGQSKRSVSIVLKMHNRHRHYGAVSMDRLWVEVLYNTLAHLTLRRTPRSSHTYRHQKDSIDGTKDSSEPQAERHTTHMGYSCQETVLKTPCSYLPTFKFSTTITRMSTASLLTREASSREVPACLLSFNSHALEPLL